MNASAILVSGHSRSCHGPRPHSRPTPPPRSFRGQYRRDFTVVNHATGAPIRLNDFAGKVIVPISLPTGADLSDSSPRRARYPAVLRARGGNDAGVLYKCSPSALIKPTSHSPMRSSALPVSKQWATMSWATHGTRTTRAISRLLSSSMACPMLLACAVAVLYRQYSYPGATALRQVIETVHPTLTNSGRRSRCTLRVST